MAAVLSSPTSASRSTSAARALLTCGVVAGPLYVGVGALEMLTRPGFDPLRHDLSLMSNGDFGWIHTSLLIVAGLLVVASSVGMRSALNRVWAARLIAVYGVGLIGAGMFAADPAYGFPVGTPADESAVSWHGVLHLVSGAIGFVGFIGACFVVARWFSARKQRGWAAFSRLTGILFAAAFVGIASGSQQGGFISAVVIVAFTAAVVLGWAWLSLVQLQFLNLKEVAE